MTSYLNIPDNWAALAAARDAKMAADEAMKLTRAGQLHEALEAANRGRRHLAAMETLLDELIGRNDAEV